MAKQVEETLVLRKRHLPEEPSPGRRSRKVIPMTHGVDRILTTHAGALPRPDDLAKMVFARGKGEAHDKALVQQRVREETKASVARQVACGLDSVNDGEVGKTNFLYYVQERVSGYEVKPDKPRPAGRKMSIIARDRVRFPKFFEKAGGWVILNQPNIWCTGELKYIGAAALAEDLAAFKDALQGVNVTEAYLPAVTPGSIEHWLSNEYYPSDESFLFAIADAMRPEYQAIVDAGFLLQIDDPDLADGWQMYPDMSVADYRKYAELRVDAINHGIRDIPREKIRLHVCWGSNHGPHLNDIPLKDIVDIIFKVRAGSYSIEASNPVHEHEWRVFKDAKLPEGTYLVPGVVGHCTDLIEHPEVVADRLVRYAEVVGRENVMAGTDCGLGPRIGEAEIAWAKLEALVKGAELASKRLWGRH